MVVALSRNYLRAASDVGMESIATKGHALTLFCKPALLRSHRQFKPRDTSRQMKKPQPFLAETVSLAGPTGLSASSLPLGHARCKHLCVTALHDPAPLRGNAGSKAE